MEQRYDRDLVKTLDGLLWQGDYEESIWVQRTGNTLDDLWALYGSDPQIE